MLDMKIKCIPKKKCIVTAMIFVTHNSQESPHKEKRVRPTAFALVW